MLRGMYRMFEKNLNRRLAVQAIRKLYRSIGSEGRGFYNWLRKAGVEMEPMEFMLFAVITQHQMG
jgi:hypothetical protein